jgi:hypothetical protein
VVSRSLVVLVAILTQRRKFFMKAAVVKQPNSALILEDRPIPEPKAGQVVIRVRACGGLAAI